MTGLTIAGLSSGYGSRLVIGDLTVETVSPGQLVAVLGPNASGKSTLLKTLMGLIPARSGRVELNGETLSAMPMDVRARRVGYLPQSLPQATTLVAYELVLSAARDKNLAGDAAGDAEARVEAIFASLDLRHLALRRMGELSGGQRQLVGLAQVLVRRPGLLLLDEPTSALDLRWQLRVLDAVRTLVSGEGAIGLIAIHDINLALRYADKIVVLGHDGLLAAGEPEAMLTPDLVSRAYGVEARIERCSLGFPIVLADRAADGRSEFH